MSVKICAFLHKGLTKIKCCLCAFKGYTKNKNETCLHFKYY